MNINELKEHLENGGKIRRPNWGKDNYVYLDDDELSEAGGLLYYSYKDLLLNDWEAYGELKGKFKITHTGLYKTRDGRMAFVSGVKSNTCMGIVEAEEESRVWFKSGKLWDNEEHPVDIVSEWKED